MDALHLRRAGPVGDSHPFDRLRTSSGRGWTITYLYDPVGREIKRVYPNDARVTSTYDLAGRVLAVRDESGVSSFTLDPLGRRTRVFDPSGVQLRYTYDAVGNRLTMRDQDAGLTTYEYNANDQLELLVNPFAETTSWSWDRLGRVAEQTLANGVRASHTYNALGQMTKLAHLQPDLEPFAIYTATYDRVGNRIQVDEVNGTYYYGYDHTHQLTSEQRTGSYAYHYAYTYDPVGNRLMMDQGNGTVVSYTYDLGDQLLATSPAGPDEALCVFEQVVAPPYSRDALALRYTMHETELLVEQASLAVVGAAGAWDASNHWLFSLQVRDDSLAPVRTLATATYEQAGAGIVRLPVPALEQYVDGAASPELTVRVEKIGAPGNLLSVAGSASIWESIGQAWIRAGSDAPSFPALLPDPYHQDALGLILPLSAGHTYAVVAATVNLVGAAGTWDASNHWVLSLSSRSASLGVDTVLATATFDSGGQGAVVLTPASPVEVDADTTPVLAIAFERVGNPGLLLRANATVAFAGAGEAGITSITYDGNGNTVSEAGPGGITTYTWNAEDRLVAVETAEGTEQYTYAADGLRRRKVTAEGTTEFVWDGQNLLAELDGDLATQAQQTDFPGYWGGLASRRAGGASGFFGFDMSGNARGQTDEAGSVEAEQAFSAFGVPIGGEEQSAGFGGQFGYRPDATGRVYVRARHLGVVAGRWLSVEPLRPRIVHLGAYSYVGNNPLRLTDPTGLVPEGIYCGGAMQGLEGPEWHERQDLIRSCKDWSVRGCEERPRTMPNYQPISAWGAIPRIAPTPDALATWAKWDAFYFNPPRYSGTDLVLYSVMQHAIFGIVADDLTCNALAHHWWDKTGTAVVLGRDLGTPSLGQIISEDSKARLNCTKHLRCAMRFARRLVADGRLKCGQSLNTIGCYSWSGEYTENEATEGSKYGYAIGTYSGFARARVNLECVGDWPWAIGLNFLYQLEDIFTLSKYSDFANFHQMQLARNFRVLGFYRHFYRFSDIGGPYLPQAGSTERMEQVECVWP